MEKLLNIEWFSCSKFNKIKITKFKEIWYVQGTTRKPSMNLDLMELIS